jgi:AraC-like DNA-binding protein
MTNGGHLIRAGEFSGEILQTYAATRELTVFDVSHFEGELPTHSHERARVALILDGSVTESDDHNIDVIRKGQVVFWCEGSTHRDVFARGTRSIQVELSHDVYRHLAWYFPPPPSPIAGDRFEGATQRLLREIERYDEASPMALQATLYEIVARAARLTTDAQPVSFAVNQAIRYARESLADPLTLADLATAANVSARRLHERFAAELQTTPMEYVRDLRLAHAEALLRETDLSPSEIAGRCGFYDHAHFCRLFKRRTGIAPSQFRLGDALKLGRKSAV